MSILILAALALLVIPLTGLDLFASDIETCKHVSASLGSFVIPLRGLTAAGIKCEFISDLSLDTLACHSRLRAGISILPRLSRSVEQSIAFGDDLVHLRDFGALARHKPD